MNLEAELHAITTTVDAGAPRARAYRALAVRLTQIASQAADLGARYHTGLLAAQVLRQALQDLRSPVGFVRADAVTFWQNAESVRFWEDVVGLPGVLQREAQRRLDSGSDR